MKFGTIGAGTVAVAFAREALATGHEVVLSSRRGPESLASKVAELGHGASAATVEEAASLDYVLLAVPWPNVEDALGGCACARCPDCQGVQFDRHRALQRRPHKERRPAGHLRLGGSLRADRFRQESDRELRLYADLPRRSRDRRPVAAGWRPVCRPRPRRFRQPLIQ